MPEPTEPPQREPATPNATELAPRAEAVPGAVSGETGSNPEGEDEPSEGRFIRETVETIIREFTGPLPPPDLLKHYDEVSPGLAKELVKSVFSEGEHRRQLETLNAEARVEAMQRSFAEARWGQMCALIFGVSAMVFGCYTATHGAEWAGGFIGVGGIGSIVTTFILGRNKQDRRAQTPFASSEVAVRAAGNDRES